jgi:hypothetical protein
LVHHLGINIKIVSRKVMELGNKRERMRKCRNKIKLIMIVVENSQTIILHNLIQQAMAVHIATNSI